MEKPVLKRGMRRRERRRRKEEGREGKEKKGGDWEDVWTPKWRRELLQDGKKQLES